MLLFNLINLINFHSGKTIRMTSLSKDDSAVTCRKDKEIASDVEAALGDLLHVHVVYEISGRMALHAQPLRRTLTFRLRFLHVRTHVRIHVVGIPAWLGDDLILLLHSALSRPMLC